MSNQETSWSRREHSRKPNMIVCGIYWIADWFGDFKHLASTTRRGAGHVSAFAGYSLLLIVTLAITLFIVITSAVHSLKLLHWIGFNDWTAYLTLFVVEAIFLTGSIQIDLGLKHGLPLWSKKYMPTPPVFGFAAGLAFVLSSNVMGLASNYGGLAFGIATPFLLIISKAMLAWQYTFKSKVPTQSTEGKTPENQSVLTPEKTEELPTEIPEIPIEKSTEIDAQKTAENPDIQMEKSNLEMPEIQLKNPEMKPKNPVQKPKRNDTPTKKKEVTSSKARTAKTKRLSDVDEIVKIAIQLKKDNGEFSRADLEREANTTTHFARKAIAKLEQLEAKNPDIQDQKSNQETQKIQDDAQEIQSEKSKLQLVK